MTTLRHVAGRKAFFHNGRFKTLKEALTFYVQRDTDPGKWYPLDPVSGAIDLRDEDHGGVRCFASLGDGAFATSRLAAQPAGETVCSRHASVAAPSCMWADALTKLVMVSGDASHPLLQRFAARAWLH